MKTYNYKIQWLFPVNGNFVTKTPQLRKELYQVINAIGAKSLTSIIGRDEDLKPIWHYSGMVGFPYSIASKEVIKLIKKKLKTDDSIKHIELLRR